MKRKIIKNNGSILQIVLMIFLILSTVIICYGTNISNEVEVYGLEKRMNQQRIVEVMLRYYFKVTEDTDILMSDTIDTTNSRIHYTVDNMGDYDLINVDIDTSNDRYSIEMELVKDTLSFKKYEYHEN